MDCAPPGEGNKVGWAHYVELLALLRLEAEGVAVKPPLATCHCSRESGKPRANGRCYYKCTCGAGFKLIGKYQSEQSYPLDGILDVEGCRAASKDGTECPPQITSFEINIGGATTYGIIRCDTVQEATHGARRRRRGGPMPATIVGWLEAVLAWAVGPWLCGYCAAIALTLGRALVTGRVSEGRLDLRLHNMVWVAARSHVTATVIAAAAAAIVLALAVSRRMGGPL